MERWTMGTYFQSRYRMIPMAMKNKLVRIVITINVAKLINGF